MAASPRLSTSENERFIHLLLERTERLLRDVTKGPGFWGRVSLEVILEDGTIQRFLENVQQSHK